MGKSLVRGLILLVLSPIGAIAGEVRVSGQTVIFDAGIGEINTVTINPSGSVFDPSSGQFIKGFTITDSTSLMTVRAPCRPLAGVAMCDGITLARADIRLGNKNDSVKQVFLGDGLPIPMTVDGGTGDDTITGGPVADILDGGTGNDIIDGGDGDDFISGGFGDDQLSGGRGNDRILGNAGNDRINGGAGQDNIDGGTGDDTIDTRDGEVDTIDCGLGRDTLLRNPNDIAKRCER